MGSCLVKQMIDSFLLTLLPSPSSPSPSQYEEKDKAFKEQLSHLATLLPTLQVRAAGYIKYMKQ